MPAIDIVSPVSGAKISSYPAAGAPDLRRVMETARMAFSFWKDIPVRERARRCGRLRRVMAANIDSIADAVTASTGKVAAEALASDVFAALDFVSYCEKEAAGILASRKAAVPFYFRGSRSERHYRPSGVALVISPWNYPLYLALVPAVSAIVAGNAVILKPSEITLNVGELITSLFAEAGFPSGLFQAAYGGGETARELIDLGPDRIFFTGSTATGRKIMQQASRRVIPLVLELGSKDPMIVFDDADLARAAAGAVYGAFSNTGQTCVSVERLYVQSTVFERFLELLTAAAARVRAGSGADADIGPLVSERQMRVVEDHIADALAKGAVAVTPIKKHGLFLHPVILRNVDHSMKVMTEETFGPVLPVMPFSDEDEAVRLANDSAYGLSASVWTADTGRGKRVALRIEAGTCSVNDVVKTIANPSLPFGGTRLSGFGRYHGSEGLRFFTDTVAVTINPGREREINWFPYSQMLYDNLKNVIRFVFGQERSPKLLADLLRGLSYVRSRTKSRFHNDHSD